MTPEDYYPNQASAQLKNIFNINEIFKRRGLKVANCENTPQILFNTQNKEIREKSYEYLKSCSFRQVISFIANNQYDVTKDMLLSEITGLERSTAEVKIEDAINKGIETEMIVKSDSAYYSTGNNNFGATFEWFVSAICVRELGSIAYWGVEIENLTGDYDVILIRGNQLGFIECKSGKLSNITQDDVKHFLKRERLLASHFSIFLVDGVSREKLDALKEFALEENAEYDFEIPGSMQYAPRLEAEIYKNFIRLTPINSFLVSVEKSISETLKEIYQFLTEVYDRTLPLENRAAKNKFKPEQS